MADRETRAKLARLAAGLNARTPHAGRLPPLALMTDDRLADPVAAARALPRGNLVILRARDDRRRAALAERLCRIACERDLVLLIASDPDLAARIGADGMHLPEARAQEAAHWRARHPNWLITCAAHDARAIARAGAARADAVFVSPVFTTKSHGNVRPLGVMRFRALVRAVTIPVYALGGIDARTALRLKDTPIAGLAAVGALSV